MPNSIPTASPSRLGHSLKPRQLIMMGLGSAIGAGLFLGSGVGVQAAGPAVLVSYLVAGALVIIVMNALGEMAAAKPTSGAFSVYAADAMGATAGATVGWLWWVQLVIVIAAEAVGAAGLLATVWPAIPVPMAALAFMLFFTAINLLGVKNFGEFEFWFAILKVAAILAFIAIGVALLMGWLPQVTSPGLSNFTEHGGFAPNGATFLVFTDYARGAMRLSALMGTGVVYVMTHDSIGLGEDGPTHQPVEHLSALRAIPNMRVFRPCDAVETAECWELALNRVDGPTVLALTRQNLPQLRTTAPNDNPCSHGAYELVAAQGEAKVSLFASGSEVQIAVEAQKQLAGRGIATRVVSVPSLELLLAQPAERQNAIIGKAPVKIAIEAAVRWGWDAVIGHDGEFIGMHGFGASAPAKDLFPHFGITAEAVVNAATKRV